MSKLAEILRADTEPQCKTCRYLRNLPPEDRDALTSALLDITRTNTFIASALTSVGFRISESSIRRHRRSCDVAQGSAERP